MEHELRKGQKADQGREGKTLETEEKIANTIPELAVVSEIVKGDKGVKREIGVVLNEENKENKENINTIVDKENDDKEKKEQKKSEDEFDSNKINIKGSIEKKIAELDDSDHIKMISDTTLSLTGSKEKIVEGINLDNVSISKTIEKSSSGDKAVENIHIDETVVETPLETTTLESISKIENYKNEPTVKSLKTDKTTVQNLETGEITSTETAILKKEVTEVSPDQTLIETIVFKGNKDKISKEMNVRSIEVKKTFENDIKDQKNIESITKQETTSETPVDKTTVTTVVTDSSTINKVTSAGSNEEDLVISQNDAGDKSKINVVTATEVREEKPQFEDNDDEDLETPAPVTPEGEEDLLITISKEAPELVSDVRDLKQISDKLDPIKRSWNDLKSRKGLEHSLTTESDHDIKSDEVEELVQKTIDSMKEGAGEDEAQEVDQEGEIYYSDGESGSPPKRIKIEINWNDIYGEEKVLLSNVQEQTLIQPTTSSPSAIVSDVMNSMFIPGFNNNVVIAMNICFWLLFTSLILLAVLTDFDQMVLLNLSISVTLYIALHWFVIYTRAAQAEEASRIAKKED